MNNKPAQPSAFLSTTSGFRPPVVGARIVEVAPPKPVDITGESVLLRYLERLEEEGQDRVAAACFGPFSQESRTIYHKHRSYAYSYLTNEFVKRRILRLPTEGLKTLKGLLAEPLLLEAVRFIFNDALSYRRSKRLLEVNTEPYIEPAEERVPAAFKVPPLDIEQRLPVIAPRIAKFTRPPAEHIPNRRDVQSLSVRLPNRVMLSKALLLAIPHLGPSAPVELVPPPRRGGTWHLDTRPTAGRRLPKGVGEAAQFATSHHLKPEHFLTPVPSAGPGRGKEATKPQTLENRHRSRLHFRLAGEVTSGYYALEPL